MKRFLASLAASAALLLPASSFAMHWSAVTINGADYCAKTNGQYDIRFQSQSGLGVMIDDPSSAQNSFCRIVQMTPIK